MSKKFFIIAAILVLFGAVFGGIFGKLPGRSAASDAVTTQSITDDYKEALEVVEQNYATEINREKVLESSIQGMLWTLDPHSSFFTASEFRKLYEDQSSRFYGIGVSILNHGTGDKTGVYVQAVVPDTPAQKAGLKYGDRFLEIDGKDARKWTSSEVSRNVRGERNTAVRIKIERPGSPEPLEFQIVRGGVPYPSIRNYFMLPDGTGYIGMTGGFQETTAAELDEAIIALKEQGMKQIVLDLRGNPGGLLPQAIEVVSRFVPRGRTVVSVKGRSRFARNEELRSVGNKTEDFPLVVLINGGSASASEIVAGAVQDYGRGLVVGTESFGKGLVQRVFPLPSGTGLTLTTARYYTPFGRSLQRDYSTGSIYDYYTHQNGDGENGNSADPKNPQPKGVPVTTAGGRVFYGGRGIEPDVKAQAPAPSMLRYRIGEAAFFFTRQLVAGQIPGLESYRVERQSNRQDLQPNDFQITDKMLDAFRAFIAREKDNLGLRPENLNGQLDYAKSRLRAELTTANYSSEAGQQVLLEVDPQVLKGVEVMPEARKLLANRDN